MDTDQGRSDNGVWGGPPPEPGQWGARQTALAVAVAAVIAGLGGAAIYAATGQSSQVMAPPGPGSGFGPPPGMGPGGPAGPMCGPTR